MHILQCSLISHKVYTGNKRAELSTVYTCRAHAKRVIIPSFDLPTNVIGFFRAHESSHRKTNTTSVFIYVSRYLCLVFKMKLNSIFLVTSNAVSRFSVFSYTRSVHCRVDTVPWFRVHPTTVTTHHWVD